MRVTVILADFPTGTLTGMFILAGSIIAVLLCLFIAGAMRMTQSRRAVRGWLIAAGVCVLICVLLLIIVRVLDLP